jgi:hypothetical protein
MVFSTPLLRRALRFPQRPRPSLVIVRCVRTHLRRVLRVCIGTAPLTFFQVEHIFASVRPEH